MARSGNIGPIGYRRGQVCFTKCYKKPDLVGILQLFLAKFP
jgi:hypothetical protein